MLIASTDVDRNRLWWTADSISDGISGQVCDHHWHSCYLYSVLAVSLLAIYGWNGSLTVYQARNIFHILPGYRRGSGEVRLLQAGRCFPPNPTGPCSSTMELTR